MELTGRDFMQDVRDHSRPGFSEIFQRVDDIIAAHIDHHDSHGFVHCTAHENARSLALPLCPKTIDLFERMKSWAHPEIGPKLEVKVD